ncbi:glycosyl transferase [Flavobacterium palustre]|uniref:Glycosyl transferase n=1 Tax=Flavobacterium palustre TaxID=1476463 RepID=A0ABQ1HQD5_9FLAO|nr:glycosyltransferase [Flavobacterium palustre]GGA86166.1 glycosyl transferase [Flavobacterium palustre]
MRVLQLIDSLEAGGAERMALNYANALSAEIEFSGLVATRKEGVLKKQLDDKVHYLFLNKKNTVDFKAVLKLRKYIIRNQVQLIQAHSSSFFLAVLVKLTLPNIKIIWHDHYGNSEFLENRSKYALQLASFFFNGSIAVNEILKHWASAHLYCKNGIYLSNFATIEDTKETKTIVQGQEGKRILCLANLRRQKNHFLLVEVATRLKVSHPDWSFHLVGKDFEDNYSHQLKEILKIRDLQNHVFVYNSCSDVGKVLEQVQLGVLTSDSEGLPVALLEYALHKKAVVVTSVGQVSAVVQDGKNGFLIPAGDVNLFYNRLTELINNPSLQDRFSESLYRIVVEQFSQASIIKKYIHWINIIIVNE